ncbi:hypothetical protein DY000_02025561 [Brassica cretica]|uniref:AUGMIN subunit 5 n=1 Tax=Brassica cretica TaxID=69181 RepID=A0ABQ7E2Y5_BRACR|nr:hypothetical protein DY000_02025561 [Brassica cretica]
MQSVSSSAPTPEAILEWLQKEMGYRSKSHVPSVDAIRKVCRGNMIPIWSFLMNRAKSEKTVESIRRNITVHGGSGSSSSDANPVKEESKAKGRRKEKAFAGESREAALCEREAAAKEVERLRNVVRRQRKDLKARMLEVSREEAERKRMLDERANYRHKQVTLEAYDQQCDEAARIFAEYHKRLQVYVNQARNAQRSSLDSLSDLSSKLSTNSEREAVYSSVRGSKSADDVILVETARERSIRRACESLASHMADRISNSFPAYEGNGIHSHPEVETAKLSFEYDGEISDEMRGVIVNCLSSPPLLLQAIAAHTLRLKTLISKEIERVDIRADAETLSGMALLESMGANGSTGPEAVAAAEKNAALLTARAGARDPSAIPSICRISAALQYPAGLEGSDASLASVLESLEFCLRLRGSEACVLEDLAKAINLVDIRQDLVESGRSLLSHAYHAQQEYERTTKHCLDLATEQDNTITEKWLPELKTAVLNAQASLEHCKHVWGLLDEWYEQPAATVVDWVRVDGQNVAAWHNHVKSSYCLLR